MWAGLAGSLGLAEDEVSVCCDTVLPGRVTMQAGDRE